MNKLWTTLLVTATTFTGLTIAADSVACTRMLWNTDSNAPIMVGRNEDYYSASNPTLVMTPRGIKRVGTSEVEPLSGVAHWVSKYGSLVVYANNRFPMDGMNEKGLTARTLYFNQGEIDQLVSDNDQSLQLDGDHWVSYILDNFATVNDAVKAIKERVHLVAVKGGYSYSATPKHLSIADSTGDSAIIEIQEGQVKVFHGEEYRVMTNPPNYQSHLKDVATQTQLNPNSESFPSTWSADDRFLKADYWLKHFPKMHDKDANAAYGFMYQALGNTAFVPGMALPPEDALAGKAILKELSHPEESYGVSTYFQSISDLTNKVYRFKSLIAPSDVYLDLKKIDFASLAQVKVIYRIDEYAQQGFTGNLMSHFTPITGDIYQQQIR
ncbi:linear amide C-N hydrolase [Shewanella psychropiezotolerans]|uniref:Linear amide C-N hydrolase n=1 Tax=Shewanella psychropiezotolerans TaxID=2593655 RepID=A0ABX5X647_9GAMM|nr:linear amide C-N hydrolase [Shewanella psychropiezotolerans]QDO85897.1 linear amide C-N hydrolase [Shewanella psychropiezotolerans]